VAERARDAEVMQLVDGELTPAETAEVEAAMGREPGLRGKAEGVRELRELVRGHLELTADEIEPRFARLWEQIDKRIEHDRTPVPVPSRRSSSTMEAASPTTLLGRIGRFFDRRRAHIITGVVSAGAVAAIALVLRGRGDDRIGSDGGAISVTNVVDHRPPEVESLDTPEGSGTVFTIADEDGDAAVIWVEPADTVEGL
jgi:anti-sigma factor RsiW